MSQDITDKKFTFWIETFKVFSIFIIVLVTAIGTILFRNNFESNKLELILLFVATGFLIFVLIIFWVSIYKLIKLLKK
ncbi:MAG: hypothetical protein IIA88_06465 [Bacteroidetes bacterium]|nr:hypothetical protein [Bacteroidota bacterium]